MINANELPNSARNNLENPYLHLEISSEVDKLSDLRFVEDEIFLSMYPGTQTGDEQYAMWSCRPNIEDILRPRGFNGTITDIHVERMDNPLLQLVSSNERGLRFLGIPPTHSRLKNEAFRRSHHEGLIVTAHAISKNSGTDMPLRYEVWYSQLPERKITGITSNNFGHIVRYVARDLEQDIAIEQFPRRAVIGRIGVNGALGSSMPISRGSYRKD